MEPTFPINYRAGWIEPVDEYIPERMEPNRNGQPQVGFQITDLSLTMIHNPHISSPILPKHTKKCNTWNPSIKNTLLLNSSMNLTCWICQLLHKIRCMSHEQVPKENHYA